MGDKNKQTKDVLSKILRLFENGFCSHAFLYSSCPTLIKVVISILSNAYLGYTLQLKQLLLMCVQEGFLNIYLYYLRPSCLSLKYIMKQLMNVFL